MARLIESATTTKVLCCVLTGVNAAYLFRGDLLVPKLMAVGFLVLMAVLLLVVQYSRRKEDGGGEDGEGQPVQGRLTGIWMNTLLLALVLVSVRGATA